jgi:hypothetical protein
MKTSNGFYTVVRHWLKWTIANALTALILIPVGFVGFFLLLGASNNATAMLAGYLIVGGIIGALIGTAQSFVLPKYVSQQKWIGASAAGMAIGFVFAQIASGPVLALRLQAMEPPVLSVINGLAVGVSIGVMQWLVLRIWVSHARWWIVANALGGMLGASLASYLAGLASNRISEYAGPIAFVGIALSVAGAVSGIAFAWLLRQTTDTLLRPG